MATISDPKSIHATLTGTTVDIANLQQFWDAVEVTNSDGVNNVWVRFDGTDPVAAAEGAFIVPPGSAKVFRGVMNQAGVPGSTTLATMCCPVKVLGNGGAYSVEGISG